MPSKMTIYSRIKRMREIKPMWRMCRILKKNRAEWVVQISSAQAYDSNKEKIEQFSQTPQFEQVLAQESFLNLLHGEEQQGELKVNPNGLIIAYIQKYVWENPNQIINISSTDTTHQKEIVDTRAILEHCIKHKPSFIERDGKQIYLTTDGDKFTEWNGLIKEWAHEIGELVKELNPVYKLLLGIAGVVIAIKWSIIWGTVVAFSSFIWGHLVIAFNAILKPHGN